jgi:carnitine 3-dehydrogenase
MMSLSHDDALHHPAGSLKRKGIAMSANEQVLRVAVIGTGTIGASWIAYFLSRGLDVTASDPAPGTKSFVERKVEIVWPTLARLGLAPGASPSRLRFHADPLEAVEGADFVQENGPENENIKIQLFEKLDAVVPTDVILASSSSGLLMSRIQAKCRNPERCVIGHPFNPPHLIPLVEVVGGARTAALTVKRAIAFYMAIGKRPIWIKKEVQGHVANRLQAALWREAAHLVAEDVASVGDIDSAVAYGPGLRWALMGQSMTWHLGGGDGGMRNFMKILGPAVQSWWDDLGQPTLTPKLQQKIIDGVDEEATGHSIGDLAARRDFLLLEMLAFLKTHGNVVDQPANTERP